MKQRSADNILALVANLILASVLLFSIFVMNSFTVHHIGDDFMKQLGISKTAADEKITNSILGGSLDAYGLKNIKSIVTGNKAAITKDLLVYTKNHMNSPAFKKEYDALKQSNKPVKNVPQTPEAMKAEYITAIKKMIADSEAGLKTANSTMKPVYEKMLAEGKKQLAAAEAPNHPNFSAYEKNYPQLVKDIDAGYERQLQDWEKEYPSDASQFIKRRLEAFMEATNDIDFNAELVTKGGTKYFVNKEYENKDNRWKMAFRAGKEVVEPARAFVQQWIDEIK